MVKVKKVKIVLPVEGKKSYKDILELLSDENEFTLEKKESVKEVSKEFRVEGTAVYNGYIITYEDKQLILYSLRMSIDANSNLDIDLKVVKEYMMAHDLYQKIKQRFEKAMKSYPRLNYGDNLLAILMGTVVYGPDGMEVRDPGDMVLFSNDEDIKHTLKMTSEQYEEFLVKQKAKALREQEVEKEKQFTGKYYEELEKERRKWKEYQESKR